VPLALRAWLRYLVPLTLLAVITCAPLLYIALHAHAAKDVAAARIQVRVPWLLASFAWIFQLWLVAAAAPLVRSIADANPLSQIRALIAGLRGLVRGALPIAAVVAAILLGGLALAVPGVLLLVLLSLTGASEQLREPLPAPLLDSIAAVRVSWRRVVITLAAIIVVGLVVTFVVQKLYVPPIKSKVPPSKLVGIRTFLRVVGLSLTAMSPLAACLLAACYRSQRSR
jgi:hypothetical protein